MAVGAQERCTVVHEIFHRERVLKIARQGRPVRNDLSQEPHCISVVRPAGPDTEARPAHRIRCGDGGENRARA